MNVFDQLERLLSQSQKDPETVRASDRLQKTMEDLQRAFTNQATGPAKQEVKTWTEERFKQQDQKKITDFNLSQAQQKFASSTPGTQQHAQAQTDLLNAERDATAQNKRVEDATRELDRTIRELAKALKDSTLRGPLSSTQYKETFQRMQKEDQEKLAQKRSLFDDLRVGYKGGKMLGFGGGADELASLYAGGKGLGGAAKFGAGLAGHMIGGLQTVYQTTKAVSDFETDRRNRTLRGQEATIEPLRELSPSQKAISMWETLQQNIAKIRMGENLAGTEQALATVRSRLNITGRAVETKVAADSALRSLEELQHREVARTALERVFRRQWHNGVGRAEQFMGLRAEQLEMGRQLSEAKNEQERQAVMARLNPAGTIPISTFLDYELKWQAFRGTALRGLPAEERRRLEEERNRAAQRLIEGTDKAQETERQQRAIENRARDMNAALLLDPLGPGGVSTLFRSATGQRSDMEAGYRMGRGEAWYTAYGREPRFQNNPI